MNLQKGNLESVHVTHFLYSGEAWVGRRKDGQYRTCSGKTITLHPDYWSAMAAAEAAVKASPVVEGAEMPECITKANAKMAEREEAAKAAAKAKRRAAALKGIERRKRKAAEAKKAETKGKSGGKAGGVADRQVWLVAHGFQRSLAYFWTRPNVGEGWSWDTAYQGGYTEAQVAEFATKAKAAKARHAERQRAKRMSR